MRILLDMNLSPTWVPVFARHGFEALHWSEVGDARAPDTEIMVWARSHGYVVFTHDLDFGAMLAATGAEGPSVIQIRTNDTLPAKIEHRVISALQQFAVELDEGALIVLNEHNARVRVLPRRRR